MPVNFSIDAISAIIQIAVAPVFLLVGISGFLNMLSARLGRIIDRKRVVDSGIAHCADHEIREEFDVESVRLRQRIKLANRAIRLCVASALAVCLLVVSLFISEYLVASVGLLIAGLFMLAMLLIIAALVAMLCEVTIATRQANEGSATDRMS